MRKLRDYFFLSEAGKIFRENFGKKARRKRSSDLVAVWKFLTALSRDDKKKVTSRVKVPFNCHCPLIVRERKKYRIFGSFLRNIFPCAKNVRIFFGFFLTIKSAFLLCARTKTHTHDSKRTHTNAHNHRWRCAKTRERERRRKSLDLVFWIV